MKLSSLVTRLSSLVTVAFAAATANADPTVGQVLVHQLWPWSQNVKVEYTLNGTEGGTYDIAVTAAENGVVIDAAKLSSALCGGEGFHSITGDGIHTFTLDPSKLVSNGATALGNFTVSVTVADPGDPLGYRVEYRVFDLETGDVTDLTRRDIYDHPELYGSTVYTNYADVYTGFAKPADLPAEDVFLVPGFNENDVWKTTKLVMKRIPAKDVVWYMGPAVGDTDALAEGTDTGVGSARKLGETRFQAEFTEDFFIGVFELTQKQFALIMEGARPSFYANETYWQTRPVENYDYTKIVNNFIPAARTALGKQVNLPTEAQWEFAAKARYDGTNFPCGLAFDLANWKIVEGINTQNGYNSVGNATSAVGSGSGTVTVGYGKPNPFGLYNTLGNVSEFVLDVANKNLGEYYASQIAQGSVVNPYCTSGTVASSTRFRMFKGASFRNSTTGANNNSPRCAARVAIDREGVTWGNQSDRVIGFRLLCPAD